MEYRDSLCDCYFPSDHTDMLLEEVLLEQIKIFIT